MSKSSITLAMIVKDEAKTFPRLAASVRDIIDQYLIIDTGSTDDTIAVVKESLDGIPGTVLQEDFQDFAWNRTSLVQHARNMGDYLLLLDADHELVAKPEDFEDLEGDGYYIHMVGGFDYWMPYLVRSDIPWYYLSPTHEYLTASEPFILEKHPTIKLMHHCDGGTRNEKFERDLALLEVEYAKDPTNPRTVFYLAQTLKDLGDTRRAADLYRDRTHLGGWDEEIYVAHLRAGECLNSLDDFIAAWNFRPTRPEARYHVIRRLNELSLWKWAVEVVQAHHEMPPTTDMLFVDRWMEDWGIAFQAAIAHWYTGKKPLARDILSTLLTRDDLPPEYRAAVENNLTFCE